MACTGPTSLAAAAVGCVEPPPCAIVSCYRNLLCLIYDTTAHVLAGCRSPNDGNLLYCVCPQIENTSATKMSSNSSANNFTLFSTFTTPTYSTTTALIAAPLFVEQSGSTNTTPGTTSDSSGIGGGAIAGIVIGVLIILALIAVAAFFAVRKIRERRKNHGEYRPQWEEYQHAKDLPYLPPPAIEGLI